MRSTSEVDAEAWVLTTDEGRGLLAEVATVAAPGPADLSRWRRAATSDRVSAALRLSSARRRGRAKFSRADRMWLDPIGLEQATAEEVARHKARRFSGAVVVDLCAGIGGDAVAMARESRVLAVDADPGMCRRVGWNAEVYEVADRVAPVRARAETFGIPPGALVHVDPDRRGGPKSRARLLLDYVPGLDSLKALPARVAAGAIKLGPASDFEAHFGSTGFEVELISLRGECKEATVWFRGLATCRRRATRLPEGVTWTERDGSPTARPGVVPPSSWLYDPDPALVRSGLVSSFAAAHGLERCGEGVDFLTGSDRVASPFLAAFEVEEVVPFDLKTLRGVVAARGIGPLEIKVRGLDARPEDLRSRLRPPGPNPATLLLIGGAGPARAVIARRDG
jgi:hypothetical protein